MSDWGSHSGMSDSATLGTVARQVPLSMGFSWQEYWSVLWRFLDRRQIPYRWATGEVLEHHNS